MNGLILITGATGYVGGRLWRRFEAEGKSVRCMVRRKSAPALQAAPTSQIVEADVLKPETLEAVFQNVETAYYLIHSMGAGSEFEIKDRTAARNFGNAARRAGVRRIIYLGALAHGQELSPHLKSRQEVGDVLRESGVQVIEFRASIVIGSGSLSFEMIRALVERLPVMITPRWVEIQSQPIAIDDLIEYLVAALDVQYSESRIFEIGGADKVSYGDLMREYARQRGLRRLMIRVPLLTPRLSGLWLGLVTPLQAQVGKILVESIKHPTVVRDTTALEVFPVKPMGMRDAIAAAIRNEEREFAGMNWYEVFMTGGQSRNWAGVRFGNRFIDSLAMDVDVRAEEAFAPIQRIGGDTGWYAFNWMWRLRGFFERLIGGVGMRRGRPASQDLRVGDTIDFWRVEAYKPNRQLRLFAEMKVFGHTWLEFEVVPRKGGATIRQTSVFEPLGLSGIACWYLLYPIHRLVFSRMLRNIARVATSGITKQ